MATMMLMSANTKVMGKFVITGPLRVLADSLGERPRALKTGQAGMLRNRHHAAGDRQ